MIPMMMIKQRHSLLIKHPGSKGFTGSNGEKEEHLYPCYRCGNQGVETAELILPRSRWQRWCFSLEMPDSSQR